MTRQQRMILPFLVLASLLVGPAPALTTKLIELPTMPAGPVNLLADAAWEYSTDGGKTFSQQSPVVPAGKKVKIVARTFFDLPDGGLFGELEPGEHHSWSVLELTHGLSYSWKPVFELNGKAVKGPLDGMFYRTIPAIDAALLREGKKNVLTAGFTVHNRRRGKKDISAAVKMSLAALVAEDLKIQTGPILGAFGDDYFSVTCRTNMPATVTLYRTNAQRRKLELLAISKAGLMHRLRGRLTDPQEKLEYLLVVGGNGTYRTHAGVAALLGKDRGKLRFVAMGDSRTHPDRWAQVAAAAVKAAPKLIVFSGDMVNRGWDDWQWDEQFFSQAGELFATIPFYAVIGNHEANAPVFNELFYTPTKDGRGRNWSQLVRGVLLIGVDGTQNWSAGSENAKWLDKTLSEARGAKFIFLFNHFPPWTSGRHGRFNEDGTIREREVREGREVILPLLAKHKATAFIAGHDHFYERSEPSGGVTVIISGGAGAPLRDKAKNAEKQNPHSKVFAKKLHYCLFEIEGDTCTMKALTPDGEQIDKRVWKAR